MTERKVKCPLCGKPALFSPENPYRPFCSERCRLTDLGQWAEGKYAVPVGQSLNNSTLPDGSLVQTPLDEEDIEEQFASEIPHSAHQSDDND